MAYQKESQAKERSKCCKDCAEAERLRAEASKLKAEAYTVVYQVRYQAWVSLLKTVVWAVVVCYGVGSDFLDKFVRGL